MTDDDAHHDANRFAAVFRQTFAKANGTKARRVMNVLLESPFFYREDDLDLFAFLRRQRAMFAQFFEEFFGWELYVDEQVARLVKPEVANPALRPSQRHVFRISGRMQYVLFCLLLEFYQRQADVQNLDIDKEPEVRFVLADFVQFVFERYRAELGEQGPAEQEVLNEMRTLFRELERCRFIAERERQGVVAAEGPSAGFTERGMEDVLYALLPGLRCYRSEVLTRDDLLTQAARDVEQDEQTEASADDEGAAVQTSKNGEQP